MKQQFIQEINASPWQMYYSHAGGGSSFFSEWLAEYNATQTIVGGINNNAFPVTNDFLGKKPEKYVCLKTTRLLARRCFDLAIHHSKKTQNVVGISSNCSIKSENEREGREHRFFFVAHTFNSTFEISMVLNEKDGFSRMKEEIFARELLTLLLAKVAGRDYTSLVLEELEGRYHLEAYQSEWNHLAKNSCFSYPKEEALSFERGETLAIIPGSFHPPTRAHCDMYHIMKANFEHVFFELCIDNTDKAGITYADLHERCEHILKLIPEANIIITNSVSFVEKISTLNQVAQNCSLVFGVGNDTWKRFVDPEYYVFHDDPSFASQSGVRFVVFARDEKVDEDKTGHGLQLKILDANNYHNSVSSTLLRTQENV